MILSLLVDQRRFSGSSSRPTTKCYLLQKALFGPIRGSLTNTPQSGVASAISIQEVGSRPATNMLRCCDLLSPALTRLKQNNVDTLCLDDAKLTLITSTTSPGLSSDEVSVPQSSVCWTFRFLCRQCDLRFADGAGIQSEWRSEGMTTDWCWF